MHEPGARAKAEALEADCPRHRLEPGAEPMSKLSDTQAIVLSAACQRLDGNLLPLPGSLRGGAAGKVVAALLSRGLAEERILDSTRRPTLRSTGSGAISTTAALSCCGSLPPGSRRSASGRLRLTQPKPRSGPERAAQTHQARPSPLSAVAAGRPSASHSAPLRGTVREGTKQAALVKMLRRPKGATIAEIVEATGWQAHTVRGAFAGALKKRLGLTLVSGKVEGRGRVYRID